MTANFDRVARIYRWAEYLSCGPLLQRTRTHFLPQLVHARRALVLGDGDGRFLARLLQVNPEVRATAVDGSAQMLGLLRARCAPASDRVETVHTDALIYTPASSPDLIATHFFLDCFTQLQVDTLVARLANTASPDALWVVSDFRIPSGPLRHFARVYICSLYFAFRLLTGLRVTQLPHPATALTSAGFRCIDAHETLGGLLYTELWQRTGSDIDALEDAVLPSKIGE